MTFSPSSVPKDKKERIFWDEDFDEWDAENGFIVCGSFCAKLIIFF